MKQKKTKKRTCKNCSASFYCVKTKEKIQLVKCPNCGFQVLIPRILWP